MLVISEYPTLVWLLIAVKRFLLKIGKPCGAAICLFHALLVSKTCEISKLSLNTREISLVIETQLFFLQINVSSDRVKRESYYVFCEQ